ncbi:hypothetical protein [Hydrogenophaga sp.]|uniref:hypothetical protein n=1 Tax=Hydrogenophaga sp. TaxID=1904254 RepID=UPI0025C0464C|nr:hypothetical protein [Hydrogenophaga sp.]
MSWPTSNVVATNLDAGTDSPATARADLLDLVQKFNELRSHVSGFAQTVLDDADASTAQTTLGGTTVGKALFTAADAASGRSTLGIAPLAFQASRSSNSTVSSGVTTSVAGYLTEDFDTDSCFNPTTGRFTPNVAGWYFCSYQQQFYSGLASITQCNTYLYKNASASKLSYRDSSSIQNNNDSVSGMIYMNGTTDYVEARFRITVSSSSPGISSGTFSAFRVSA